MPETSPSLPESEVVQLVLKHIQGSFPKTCPHCQRVFPSYREYLLNTKPIGLPVSYDLEFNDWKPQESTGNLSQANCRCGTTLSLSSDGMPKEALWKVLYWIKVQAETRQVKISVVLGELREKVQARGLPVNL